MKTQLKMNLGKWVVWISSALALGAGNSAAGEKGLHLVSGLMYMSNSTQQGGQGPEGSTLLTQSEMTYHSDLFAGLPGLGWGIGFFAQYDKQGLSEKDLGLGPKFEVYGGPLYFEGGYISLLNRSFTDRSIAKQSGNGLMFGVGARFKLGSGQGGAQAGPWGNFFMQFTYKWRIQRIKTQDNIPLSENIVQSDNYPLFGLGYIF